MTFFIAKHFIAGVTLGSAQVLWQSSRLGRFYSLKKTQNIQPLILKETILT